MISLGLVFDDAALKDTAISVIDCLFHGIETKEVKSNLGTSILFDIEAHQLEALETEVKAVNANLAQHHPEYQNAPALRVYF